MVGCYKVVNGVRRLFSYTRTVILSVLIMPLLTVPVPGPLQPTSAGGSMYVVALLGDWSDPFCGEARTTELDMTGLLEGTEDHIICIDGTTDAQSRAEALFELRSDGFKIHDNGWGEAIGLDIHDAFSRHDINASMEVRLELPQRLYVSRFMFSAGIASVLFEVRKIGELDGPDDLFDPIISRSLGSYIDPVSDSGSEVLYMPAGRYRIRQASTHQAMDTKPGFTHAFARHTHHAWYTALGDVDGNMSVTVEDLLAVLGTFGPCEGCQSDLDGDGQVGIEDVLQVLADFNP